MKNENPFDRLLRKYRASFTSDVEMLRHENRMRQWGNQIKRDYYLRDRYGWPLPIDVKKRKLSEK